MMSQRPQRQQGMSGAGDGRWRIMVHDTAACVTWFPRRKPRAPTAGFHSDGNEGGEGGSYGGPRVTIELI